MSVGPPLVIVAAVGQLCLFFLTMLWPKAWSDGAGDQAIFTGETAEETQAAADARAAAVKGRKDAESKADEEDKNNKKEENKKKEEEKKAATTPTPGATATTTTTASADKYKKADTLDAKEKK